MLGAPMHLRELLRPDDLVVGFDPADKWDAIAQLVLRMVERGLIPAAQADSIRDAVLARERSMSTGMERGVAIPHAAVEGIERVVAQLGIVQREEGLAFDSIDAQPARLVVLLVIPRSQKLLHIRTLADLARALSSESVRAELLAAATPQEAWNALAEQPAH